MYPMTTFPVYFVTSALKATGWPRRTSVFGPKGVDGTVLQVAWTGMVQASIALGAGRPIVAAQLLTQMFGAPDRPPWNSLIEKLDPDTTMKGDPSVPPWEAILHRELIALFDGFISVKYAFSTEAQGILFTRGCQGLLYGLAHPAESELALKNQRARDSVGAAEAVRAGVQIPNMPPWADNEAFFDWTEQIVKAYERTGQPLPQPDGELLQTDLLRRRQA
jgi:hypothetical protein